MAWTTSGTLKGPTGTQGPQGAPGTAGAQGPAGTNGSVGPAGPTGTQGVAGPVGAAGVDGKSVTIVGSVANAAALPTTLTTADAGKGYITQDNGHLNVWSGTVFNDVGLVQGPAGPTGGQGPQGVAGAAGPVGPQGIAGPVGPTGPTGQRGTMWFTGAGAPGTVGGSLPGDYYLDSNSGTYYVLS